MRCKNLAIQYTVCDFLSDCSVASRPFTWMKRGVVVLIANSVSKSYSDYDDDDTVQYWHYYSSVALLPCAALGNGPPSLSIHKNKNPLQDYNMWPTYRDDKLCMIRNDAGYQHGTVDGTIDLDGVDGEYVSSFTLPPVPKERWMRRELLLFSVGGAQIHRQAIWR